MLQSVAVVTFNQYFVYWIQIRDDPEHRMSVFRHHFLQHSGTNSYITKWSSDIKLDKEIKWTVIGEQAFKWEQESVRNLPLCLVLKTLVSVKRVVN